MSRDPFFKVYVGKSKRDISDKIEKFMYEDCTEEDSFLQLTVINTADVYDITEDADVQKGKTIYFQYGFLGGEQSPLHQAQVTDLERSYAARVTMDIKCLDKGNVVKKTPDQKIWDGKTSIQIAQEIADKHELTLVNDPTTKVWKNIPQGNKSDLALLQYLAKREEGGNWIVFIRSNELHFEKRGTDKSSKRTYTYDDGNGTVVSFKPKEKDSSDDPSSSKVNVKSSDPANTKSDEDVKTTGVDNDTESKSGTTGEYKRVYNGDANQIGTIVKELVNPVQDKKEATNMGNSLKKTKTLKQLTATLVTVGDPLAATNEIITMRNVAKADAGNWLVTKVTTDINSGGYTTTREMSRNGSKVKSKSKADDANTSKGKTGGDDSKTVRVYDGNANFKGNTKAK